MKRMAIALLLAVAIGCASAPVNPAPTINAVAIQTLSVLKQAGVAATAVRDAERQLVKAGTLSAADDAAFNAAFAKVQAAADTAIDAVPKATSYASMAAPVLALLNSIKAAPSLGGVSWSGLVTLIQSALAGIPSSGLTEVAA